MTLKQTVPVIDFPNRNSNLIAGPYASDRNELWKPLDPVGHLTRMTTVTALINFSPISGLLVTELIRTFLLDVASAVGAEPVLGQPKVLLSTCPWNVIIFITICCFVPDTGGGGYSGRVPCLAGNWNRFSHTKLLYYD